MNSKAIRLYALLAILLSTACHKEVESEGKFMTIEQDLLNVREEDRNELAGKYKAAYMIEKVHQENWTVAYGFYEKDAPCASDFTAHQDAIEAGIADMLVAWLSPLTDEEKSPVTDKTTVISRSGFTFKKYETDTDEEGNARAAKGKGKLILNGAEPDLGVIFYCTKGRSHVSIGRNYPLIHISHERNGGANPSCNLVSLSGRFFMTAARGYYKFILLHEIGHAFGLADVYDYDDKYSSSGGSRDTKGSQPLSVMSGCVLWKTLNFQDDVPLTLDDKEGIRGLYRYYHNNEGLKKCPNGYKFETRVCYNYSNGTVACMPTNLTEGVRVAGCVPVHPLIFAVKQGNLAILRNILQEDCSIDINEQDEHGNSPLHYAVLYEERHGSKQMCDYLLAHGIDHRLKNKNGLTALNLFPASTCLKSTAATPNMTVRQADVNGDCQVNILDLTTVACVLGKEESCADSHASQADVNRDGVVDRRDWSAVSAFMGKAINQP